MRRPSSVLLVALAVATTAAGTAVAAAPPTKVERGTYKVSASTGETVKMVVASCGRSLCLSSAPSQGSENELHLNCANTSGGGDALSDYEDYGPQKISRAGKIRTTTKRPDDGNVQTLSYTWALTSKGTLSGTGRLAETFADGATCDSGVVTFKGRLRR